MDMMDDEDLKKSVISQMMGELDDVTSDSLKKSPDAPTKGVEITISVSPKTDDEMKEEMPEACTEEGCMDPMHGHEDMPESSNYIDELKKKMGL